MNPLIAFLYPRLQRARYLKLIADYSKAAKSLPLNEKRILMLSTSKGKLGGNLAAIKRYIEENSLDFEIVTVTQGEYIKNAQFAQTLASSKFVLIDDYEPCVYPLRLRKGQQLIQVWHAMGAFKRFGYSRPTAKKCSLTHKNYTAAIVSSPEVRQIYAQAFAIDVDKVSAVGTPRTDIFFDSEYIEKVKKRLYNKEPRLKDKKVCLFAPTFRGQNVNNAYYPENYVDIKMLSQQLGDDWAVIIKMHPFVHDKFRIPDNAADCVFDFSDEREINDILFITDVLVTDYSSVIFENAVLGNAAVLYAPDLDEYVESRGFYFDYDSYSCGEIVKDFNALAKAVKNANSSNKYYKAFKERFVSLCDGNASRRFVENILKQGE